MSRQLPGNVLFGGRKVTGNIRHGAVRVNPAVIVCRRAACQGRSALLPFGFHLDTLPGSGCFAFRIPRSESGALGARNRPIAAYSPATPLLFYERVGAFFPAYCQVYPLIRQNKFAGKKTLWLIAECHPSSWQRFEDNPANDISHKTDKPQESKNHKSHS